MDKLLEMKPQETTHDIDGASLHLATSAPAPHLLAQNFKPHDAPICFDKCHTDFWGDHTPLSNGIF